jgi:hypothetical protein
MIRHVQEILTLRRSCRGPCAAAIVNSPGVMVLASSDDIPRSLVREELRVLLPALERVPSFLRGLNRCLRLGTA